jgi:hypothetical protein
MYKRISALVFLVVGFCSATDGGGASAGAGSSLSVEQYAETDTLVMRKFDLFFSGPPKTRPKGDEIFLELSKCIACDFNFERNPKTKIEIKSLEYLIRKYFELRRRFFVQKCDCFARINNCVKIIQWLQGSDKKETDVIEGVSVFVRRCDMSRYLEQLKVERSMLFAFYQFSMRSFEDSVLKKLFIYNLTPPSQLFKESLAVIWPHHLRAEMLKESATSYDVFIPYIKPLVECVLQEFSEIERWGLFSDTVYEWKDKEKEHFILKIQADLAHILRFSLKEEWLSYVANGYSLERLRELYKYDSLSEVRNWSIDPPIVQIAPIPSVVFSVPW